MKYNKLLDVMYVRVSLIAFIAAFSALILAGPAMAETDEEKGMFDVKLAKDPEPLADDIEASLDHLFAMIEDPSIQIDMAKLDPMLDFVVNGTEDPKDIKPAKRFSGNGICLRESINADMDTITRYFYNPDIPNFLLCPAVLRLSGWYPDSEFLQRKTPLWEELDSFEAPIQTRGKEFEACTPDSFGEAYFRYDINRLINLVKYQGKNVIISVSLQDDESDVGRKGAIINDQEWDYFYSGIEGLNRGLIGWMDTFMYNSASVLIYVEHDAATRKGSTFLFKWLKAGWAGMNVVKRKHIYDGTLRYVRSMSKVLESPDLTPEELAAGMRVVEELTGPQVDEYIAQYAKNFELRFQDNPKLSSKEYSKIIADGGYAEVLDKEERKSLLYLEKLKAMLGMETLVDLTSSPVADAKN